MARVLKSFELAESGRGRRAYVDWLEARAANDGGEIDQAAQDALRREWYLGEQTFRDGLLDIVSKAKGVKAQKRRKAEGVGRDYSEKDAERLVQECGPRLGLPVAAAELSYLRKGDERKALLAALLRRRTTVGFEWIASRLQMGHPSAVSRLVGNVKRKRNQEKRLNELEKMFQCKDWYQGAVTRKAATGLQCLSANSPVRTRLVDAHWYCQVQSPMPFGKQSS